ncbi:MAG: hypothetical protein AB7N65_18165 [Vicinamibacterales bacterium]
MPRPSRAAAGRPQTSHRASAARGASLTTATLYEQQRARELAERSEQQALFLASASEALSHSLDYVRR